jgi:hypothetical protein
LPVTHWRAQPIARKNANRPWLDSRILRCGRQPASPSSFLVHIARRAVHGQPQEATAAPHARVSTSDQNPRMQADELRELVARRSYQDNIDTRPGRDRCRRAGSERDRRASPTGAQIGPAPCSRGCEGRSAAPCATALDPRRREEAGVGASTPTRALRSTALEIPPDPTPTNTQFPTKETRRRSSCECA